MDLAAAGQRAGGDGHFDFGIDVGHACYSTNGSASRCRALPTPGSAGSGSAGRSEEAASQPVNAGPPGSDGIVGVRSESRQPFVRAATLVPEAEIQPVIAGVALVMRLVVAGGDDMAAEPAVDPAGGEHLPAHVIGDAHHRGDGEDDAERGPVDRDDEGQRRDQQRAGQRLPGMKRHRRPGGRRLGGMVDGVDGLEQPRPVHPAVRPVKPGVVEEQVERDAGQPPQRGAKAEISGDRGETEEAPAGEHDACGDAVNHGGKQRPADLVADLAAAAGGVLRPGGDAALGRP